jgi:hypothetical protein
LFPSHTQILPQNQPPVKTPTNLSPAVAYQSGFGQWQDFWLDDAPGNGYYLIKWRKNPAYCLNVPGSQSNVKITFFQCNAGDNDQRFRIVTVGGVQNYVQPLPTNVVTNVVNELGHSLNIPNTANNSLVQWADANYDDLNQQIVMKYNPGGKTFNLVRSATSQGISTLSLDPASAGNSSLTMYPTGEGRWQNFGLVKLNNSKFLIKWAWDPTYCMAEAEGVQPARIMLLPCDSTKKGMVWNLASRSGNEFMIFGKQTKNAQLVDWSEGLDVGHATTAIVPLIGTWEDGIKIARKYWINRDKISTYSAWPQNQCTFKNCNYDKDFVTEVLNIGGLYGTLGSGNYFSVRRQKITDSSVSNIDSKAYTLTGCTTYLAANLYYQCTCVDQATRLWKKITSEDFTPETYFNNSPVKEMSPNVVYQKIINANNAPPNTGYATGGQTIQVN